MTAAELILQSAIREIGAMRTAGLIPWDPDEDFANALHRSSAELKQREDDAKVAVQRANDKHIGLLPGVQITSYGIGHWYGWVS